MIQQVSKKLAHIFFPSYCYICKKEGSPLCENCLLLRARAYDTPYPWITSIYSFKDPYIKKIIHAIKYFHRKDLLTPLVDELIKEINQNNKKTCVLVPIPMLRLRKYIRGYNHAEEIARIVSRETKIKVATNLITRRSSKIQQVKTKSRSERLKNQHNAFSVHKNVKGMNIILIDDVTTTGATLYEARKVFVEKGASSVEAYTLAH